jgi:hypothetical protein
MGRLIIFFIFIFSGIVSSAQDSTVRYDLERTVRGNFTDLAADELGNIIVVINSGQLKKFDQHGDSVAVFNDTRRYGKIHSIDAVNPFKILVFYKESSTILILDRLLGIKQVIDLRKTNILQAKAIRQSYDNNIWIFDELDSKIKKINDNGVLLSESADLRNVFPASVSFSAIFEMNRLLYLYDISQGWFVFDFYGAFKKKYAFPGWQDAQVVRSGMTGREGDLITLAFPDEFDYHRLKANVPLKGAIRVYHIEKQTCILYPDKIEIFKAP